MYERGRVSALTAEIDFGLKLVTGQAALKQSVDRLYDSLVKAERRMYPTAGGIVPAAGPLILELGGPNPGFIWEVKMLHVGPADYTALPYATGVTVVALGQTQGDNGANGVGSWTAAWPAQGYWGSYEWTVTGNKKLRVAVIGLTAGTPVTAAAHVLQSELNTTFRTREVRS